MVPVIASALPAIATPEMRFHSVCFEGEVIEIFDWMVSELDDYRAWTIVPAYTEAQAIKQIENRIREKVINCDWDRSFGSETEWSVRSCQSVGEANVIAASKEWGVGFDDAASRMMGWLCECDRACDCCCLYSMDGLVPTCDECYRCKPCVIAGMTWWDDNRVERPGQCPHCNWT